MQVRVRDLMTVNPVSVLTGTSLQEAAEQMILAESAEIYITDHQMKLLGVVPDYQILKHKLMYQDLEAPIDSIMHVQIDALSPENEALQLIHYFRDRRNSCMAVTENGRLVGKLSCRDLFRTIMALESIELSEEPVSNSESANTADAHSTVSTIKPPHLSRQSLRKGALQLNGSKSES
ncbi:MAG: CBS domain-containing protein [Gimesia sp.]|nr:CBS domain-containing protein [Gimesia sp.]